ncbi:MAG TPA: hypothetical protein PKD37_06230 [Oligoflexia bacterium]|nr:hypothetical protein [Oligoflexia bacterium]HMP27559.1 hypothetical protein [Oligoflexia bacterium]
MINLKRKSDLEELLAPKGIRLSNLQKLWKEEIDSLRTASFQNIDQAWSAVVGATLKRLKMEDDFEAQEFLLSLIDFAPEIEEEIIKLVK